MQLHQSILLQYFDQFLLQLCYHFISPFLLIEMSHIPSVYTHQSTLGSMAYYSFTVRVHSSWVSDARSRRVGSMINGSASNVCLTWASGSIINRCLFSTIFFSNVSKREDLWTGVVAIRQWCCSMLYFINTIYHVDVFFVNEKEPHVSSYRFSFGRMNPKPRIPQYTKAAVRIQKIFL